MDWGIPGLGPRIPCVMDFGPEVRDPKRTAYDQGQLLPRMPTASGDCQSLGIQMAQSRSYLYTRHPNTCSVEHWSPRGIDHLNPMNFKFRKLSCVSSHCGESATRFMAAPVSNSFAMALRALRARGATRLRGAVVVSLGGTGPKDYTKNKILGS